MNLQEAYSILELSPQATQDEAKKRYRELSKKYHPDVNKEENATDKFKKINEAYQCVSTGQGTDPEELHWQPQHPFGHRSPVYHVYNIDLYTTISFKDSILGCKKDMKFTRKGKCNECEGQGEKLLNNGCTKCNGRGQVVTQRGNMIFAQTCDQCRGHTSRTKCTACKASGVLETEVSIDISIPGGIQNDNILRLRGMGNYAGSAMMMDQYTDAHLHITVTPEAGLSLEGMDVVSRLSISLLDALRGCTKSVKTIMGSQDVVVKPLSKNCEEIKLTHCGVNKIGTQRVILDVQYPDDVNQLINVLTNKET
jgi:molecular chaperone DnaJ